MFTKETRTDVRAIARDGIDADHALRAAVVTRKVCGNRSARGAHTPEELASVLRISSNATSTPRSGRNCCRVMSRSRVQAAPRGQ